MNTIRIQRWGQTILLKDINKSETISGKTDHKTSTHENADQISIKQNSADWIHNVTLTGSAWLT